MFFAHLPAGYLLTRGLLAAAPAARLPADARRNLMVAGLVGSVLPDADLFWFYLVSDRSLGHHAFATHTPAFWLAASIAFGLSAWAMMANRWHWLNLVVLANVLLHLALDTVAAPIRWLFPVSAEPFTLFPVDRVPGPWILSFLTHWTMLLELAITAAAFTVWRRDRLDRPVRTGLCAAKGPGEH